MRCFVRGHKQLYITREICDEIFGEDCAGKNALETQMTYFIEQFRQEHPNYASYLEHYHVLTGL